MENNKNIEIYGVKGFNKDFTCRGFKYEIGKSYIMDENSVKLCHSGFHFSPCLYSATNYYFNNSHSRYCLVKGYIPENKYNEWVNKKDKIVTNHIEIIRELSPEEITTFYKEEKLIHNKPYTDEKIYRLKELRIIQKSYPTFSLGGSVGLWLQGFNIKRNEPVSDFDFVIPYYQRMNLSDFDKTDNVTEVDQMDDTKNSGNDFDYTNGITIEGNFILMDMKINPKAKYINITYDNFTYKVCPWEGIINAKMSYLNTSTGKKHKQDLMDMFGNPKPQFDKKDDLTSFEKLVKLLKS